MANKSCDNKCELDLSLVEEFSKYYERVRNHHWMVFKMECRTHQFAYKSYVQGKRQGELESINEIAALREKINRAESIIKLVASRKCGKMIDSSIDKYLYGQ